MCLISETKIPSTSTQDIICYKILIPVGDKLFTPYRDFPFSIGEVVVDQVEKEPSEVFGVVMFEGGYFHSYKNIEITKKKVIELQRKIPRNKTLKIFKSQIPSGTIFFEGQNEDLCSKSLKIIEECFD
ncbi:MAG: hypothetical protein K2H20_01005 [Bacilli bacterium]|nr:hypothetical protein [Bacilli bacterium]